jgi:hypothetical protein
MAGTLAQELNTLVEEGQLQQFSLVKILACDAYEMDGRQWLHVREVSLVTAHPACQLGDPVEVFVLEDLADSIDPNPESDNSHHDNNGLQKLYSCYYPTDQQAKDSKIPRTGWNVEESGTEPAPRCTLIPATTRQFGDISPCSSRDEADQTFP